MSMVARKDLASMLSQRGRYAMKALLSLARSGNDRPKGVSAIAAEENIPRKFLEAIMSDLRRENLVESTRGKMGGYRLTRPPATITFGEVMRLTDGPLALLACVSTNFYRRCEDCPDEGACALRRVMATVRHGVSEILDRTTFQDAIDGMPAAMVATGEV
jgi:Rrf2 family protein